MNSLYLARQIWKYFHPLLDLQETAPKAKRGRPRMSKRRAFLGTCYLLWSGCSWRALPAQFGRRSTVHRYFTNWADSGAFSLLFKVLGMQLNNEGYIDSKIQVVDSSTVLSLFLPRTRAYFSMKYKPKRVIKFSLLVDGQGLPLATVMGKANEHDTSLLSKTLEQSVAKAAETCGKGVLLGDKGYIGPRQENAASDNGLIGVFPTRKNQSATTSSAKKKLLREKRFVVERSISWIKNLRRLKFCYEKSIERYKALLDLGCAMLLFKKIFL